MIPRLFRVTAIILTGIIALSIAGETSEPEVFLDCDFNTQEVESELNGVEEGKDYFIAVVAENVNNLYSYSLKLQFDEKAIEFVSAVKSINGESAFLESNDGNILTFMVVPKEGEVEIATTLKGSNPDVQVSGDGVLGFFKFSGKASDDPKIKIIETKMIDINGNGTILSFKEEE